MNRVRELGSKQSISYLLDKLKAVIVAFSLLKHFKCGKKTFDNIFFFVVVRGFRGTEKFRNGS